jgi:hypothetical protein
MENAVQQMSRECVLGKVQEGREGLTFDKLQVLQT